MNWLKKPSTTGGIIYLIVLGGIAVGLVIVSGGAWRSGVSVMGLSLLLAVVSRAILPDHRAGMLRIRRKFVDVTTMAVCGGAMLLLAALIPSR